MPALDYVPSAVTPDQELQRGVRLLHDPVRNKGTAFSPEERDALGLRGLLPPRIQDCDLQVQRALEQVRRKATDLGRYVFLVSLQDRNEVLFYRLIVDHLKELMPIIYTPTVGQACEQFGHIFRRPRGLFVTAEDRGRIKEVLENWPHEDVRIIVVTDGERILGLGDLGADGMGIPIGKLSLYTACAGIHPTQCLPITLDVGTENEERLSDPFYIGLPQRRVRGEAYDELLEEFVTAVEEVFPQAILQFEDFATRNAFELLARYRERIACFDDDIQGTAGVALAGIYSALRLTDLPLVDNRFLFLGAGEAGIGIADLIVAAMENDGLSKADARARCWFMDSKGLVVQDRTDLAPHKLPYAHAHEPVTGLREAVEAVKPTGLIGVSGVPRTFTRPVLERMAELNERPIVFALSNPTSKSECTARQAYRASIPVDSGAGDLRQWKPLRPGRLRRPPDRPGPGQQCLRVPRRRTGRDRLGREADHQGDVLRGGTRARSDGHRGRSPARPDLPVARTDSGGFSPTRGGRRGGGLPAWARPERPPRRSRGARTLDDVRAGVRGLRGRLSRYRSLE